MRYIWRRFLQLHDWYDEVREPFRIMLMVLLASPVITITWWVDTKADALLLLAYLVLIIGSRMIYKSRKNFRKTSVIIPENVE